MELNYDDTFSFPNKLKFDDGITCGVAAICLLNCTFIFNFNFITVI